MLLIGNGCITEDEERTQMAIWSIIASPLIMGNDMRNVSDASKAILFNKASSLLMPASGLLLGRARPCWEFCVCHDGSAVWDRHWLFVTPFLAHVAAICRMPLPLIRCVMVGSFTGRSGASDLCELRLCTAVVASGMPW
jgi:hypothetical protein